MSEIENTIGWGQGSVNNDIGWGQAQEAWCEPPLPSEPATVKNSDDSYITTVACGGTLNLPDITVTDSNGSTFSSPAVKNVTCTPSPNTNVKVNTVNKGSVAAGSTLDVHLTDGTNPVTPINSNLSGTTLTVTLPPAVTIPVGATLMKTGQTTSYRTGDDGDLEAGRATSFTVLASNNPFGNTNRFTDELGGQTYSNNWVIDWSTYNGSNVLGYFRTPQPATTWNNAVTNSLGTFGTFSGCRLWNIREALNLFDFSKTLPINYAPFSFSASQNYWTSTTRPDATNAAYLLQYQAGWSINGNVDKAATYVYIPCRTFTVTGTTLT